MRGTDISVRVDRDGLDAELAACVDDAQGDLAAVGDEDALDHRDQRGGRLSRNARNPSWPSADLRRVAMASAVNAAASSGPRSGHGRDQALGGRDGLRAARRQFAEVAGDRRVEIRGRHDGVNEADLVRARSREARARQEQLAGGGLADLLQHERRHDGRDQPQLHLGEPERGVLRGDDDVADGGEAGAAAHRGAVHASDDGHRQAVDRAKHAAPAPVRRGGSLRPNRRPSAPSTRRRRPRRTPCPRPTARPRAVRRLLAAICAAQSAISPIMSALNALRTSGRLRVRYSTAPSRLVVRYR